MIFHNSKKANILRPTSRTIEDQALAISRNRLVFLIGLFSLVFTIIIFKLFEVCLSNKEDIKIASRYDTPSNNAFLVNRAAIEDRNGSIIAVNLSTASLYANPSKVIDKPHAIDELCKIFEGSKCSDVKVKINNGKNFSWLKRHLTPIEQQHVNDLGIPGINFVKDEKRVYPHVNLLSHIIGFVDIDGRGLAGIERTFDERLNNNNEPLKLSVDVRIQQILRDEILEQAINHSAIGGSGVIMDVNTGEIIAMASLPDFDPNNLPASSERSRFNQVTLGTYEMGSTFKVLTLAMGLDGKHININDTFNTDEVIKIGNKQIKNYRGQGGIMATPEVLIYSSNIGSAQIGMKVGTKKQKAYLADLGMLSSVDIELPEKGYPLYPSQKLWNNASTITISYGHGIAVTPLHVARAISAIVNGGRMVKPTLLRVNDETKIESKRIISESTSLIMRKLLRMVVVSGYGKKADVEGYFVGGKTGTAEKLSGRVYSKNTNIASFVGAFPINDPKYVIVVLIDEALPNKLNAGFTTGGMIAAPLAGKIIERVAPLLGIQPRSHEDKDVADTLSLSYQPRNPLSFKKKP